MRDSQKVAWKRITAEGAAIVISILVAFWIDAWWEDRVEKNALVEYLVHFEDEVVANDELIDVRLRTLASELVSLHRVLATLADSDQPILQESFETDLGSSLHVNSSLVSMNAFDDLTNSGYMRFVSNIQLKMKINEYKKSADILGEIDFFSISFYLDYLVPVLSPHTVLSELGWENYETHVGLDGEDTGVTPDAPFSTNVSGLRSQEVWNALFSWKTGKIDNSNALLRIKAQGRELRDLLRAEIEYQNR